jgi:murein DD-endopeptidase MepM/ murein hydrolase activator NlpD
MQVFVSLLLILSACGSTQKSGPVEAPPGLNAITQVETQPGFVRWITFSIEKGQEDAPLKCKDQIIKHAPWKEGQRFAYVAETYFSDMQPYNCVLVLKDKKEVVVASFTVKPFKYKEEKLKVDYRTVKFNKKDLARAQKEQAMLSKLYKQSAPLPYFTQAFTAPLDSFITSIYGNRRVYNNAHKSQHLGTDYRAAIGVPIPAVNRGRVLFAGDLFYTGGTVIIDHGMDIFTVYGHLSEVKTEAGQVVKAGDIVALSGNTGRSSGPHLHWGVKVHGHYVTGYSLIDETKKQFP